MLVKRGRGRDSEGLLLCHTHFIHHCTKVHNDHSLFLGTSVSDHYAIAVSYRDVRIPHSNGIGGSTLHSRSHEHLAQPGLFNDGMGVAYGGEILNDDIRSEVTVPQHYNYRKVTLNNSGLGVPAQPLHPHGHSHSFSAGVAGGGRVPNYRSVTMGAGGGSVPVPTQSSPSHSYSGVSVIQLPISLPSPPLPSPPLSSPPLPSPLLPSPLLPSPLYHAAGCAYMQ